MGDSNFTILNKLTIRHMLHLLQALVGACLQQISRADGGLLLLVALHDCGNMSVAKEIKKDQKITRHVTSSS